MSRTILGWSCATFAAIMLVLAWGEAFSPLVHTTFGIASGLLEPDSSGKNAVVARVVPHSPAAAARLRAGDVIDLEALSLSERYRLVTGYSPVGTTITLDVRRGSTTRIVSLRAASRARNPASAFALLTNATVTLVIVALLVLLRPSLATVALVFYGAGAITTFPVIAEFSWIPDPYFGAVAVFINVAFAGLPMFALFPFLTRFPHPPKTRAAQARMHVADGLFILAAIGFTFWLTYEPLPFQTWEALALWSQVVALVIVLGFAVAAYREAGGEERRRIGWVIAGFVISAVAYAGVNVVMALIALTSSPTSALLALLRALQIGQCALPIALAYAILRHRVLDIGFAVNRTVLYATMTTLVVGVVSLLDWAVSRTVAEQRWALAIEGFVTVGFGFTLNWLHGRTERLIDRVVFRKRHIAERRIEYRIEALGFASSAEAVDNALAVDAAEILELRSAAVFGRAGPDGDFTRSASTAWSNNDATSLSSDALLVRTLRALERPIFLDDVAVHYATFPEGDARPVLAIPIVAQHELIGFTLYGNRADGASPDPEEVALLARLAAAAGNAYGAVEARQWRARATQLNALPLPS